MDHQRPPADGTRRSRYGVDCPEAHSIVARQSTRLSSDGRHSPPQRRAPPQLVQLLLPQRVCPRGGRLVFGRSSSGSVALRPDPLDVSATSATESLPVRMPIGGSERTVDTVPPDACLRPFSAPISLHPAVCRTGLMGVDTRSWVENHCRWSRGIDPLRRYASRTISSGP